MATDEQQSCEITKYPVWLVRGPRVESLTGVVESAQLVLVEDRGVLACVSDELESERAANEALRQVLSTRALKQAQYLAGHMHFPIERMEEITTANMGHTRGYMLGTLRHYKEVAERLLKELQEALATGSDKAPAS